MQKYLFFFFVEVLWFFRMPSLFAQDVISDRAFFPDIAAIGGGVLTKILLHSSITRQSGTDFPRYLLPLYTDPEMFPQPVFQHNQSASDFVKHSDPWKQMSGAYRSSVGTGEIDTEIIKALLVPDDLPDWRQSELHGQWHQMENNPVLVSAQGSVSHPKYRIYLSIIDQQFRVVVIPPTELTNSPRTTPVDFIPGLLLQIYYLSLTGDEVSDPMREAITIAAAGSGGDDDDDGQPPDHNHDKSVPYIIYGYPELQPVPYSSQHLVSQSVWLKQRLLEILQQRIQQAIFSGNHQLARVLRDRVIVIEADREVLLRFATIDITNPGLHRGDRDILPLLQTLLADALEVRQYNGLPEDVPDKYVKSAGKGGARGAGNRTGKRAKGNGSARTGQTSGSSAHRRTQKSRKKARENGADGSGEEGPPPGKIQAIRNNVPKLGNLPNELLVVIFGYLGLKEGLSLASTCKRFHYWFTNLPADLFFNGQISCYFSPTEAKEVKEKSWSEATTARRQLVLQTMRVPGYIIEKSLQHPVYPLVLLRFLSELGKISPELGFTLKGHSGIVQTVAIVSDECVASSCGNVIKLWNTRRACVRELTGHNMSVLFLGMHTNTLLVSASFFADIRVWNIITGEQQSYFQLGRMINSHITSVKLLPYPRLAFGFSNHSINIWNTETQTSTNLHNPDVNGFAMDLETLDRNRLVAAYQYDLVIWDLSTGVVAISFYAHDGRIYCLKRMRGNRLASGSRDCTIKIWNTDSWVCEVMLKDDFPITSIGLLWDNRLAFSSNRYYFPNCLSGSIKIWNPETGQLMSVLSGHGEPDQGDQDDIVTTFDDCLVCASGETLKVWQLYPLKRSGNYTL